jgi:hypothetical protein
MSVKKILSLTGGGKQLIDLNGDSINFDLTFTATSSENADFHALVVDQNTLDKVPHDSLEFKRASGSISGNIVSDKNIYQNYFLCLKSDKPCQVEVIINKKEIQPKQGHHPQNNHPQNHPQNNPQNHPQYHPQQVNATAPRVKNVASPPAPSSTNWKLICIVIVIIIGGGLCYYMYVNKKKQQKNQSIENIMTPSISTLITSPSLVSGFTTPSLSERLDKLLQ